MSSRLSQEYLDSLRQTLMGADVATQKGGVMGFVDSATDFVKKYYVQIIIAIIVIALIAYYASTQKVSPFASVSGDEKEDTENWEIATYQLPASPFEPVESVMA